MLSKQLKETADGRFRKYKVRQETHND